MLFCAIALLTFFPALLANTQEVLAPEEQSRPPWSVSIRRYGEDRPVSLGEPVEWRVELHYPRRLSPPALRWANPPALQFLDETVRDRRTEGGDQVEVRLVRTVHVRWGPPPHGVLQYVFMDDDGKEGQLEATLPPVVLRPTMLTPGEAAPRPAVEGARPGHDWARAVLCGGFLLLALVVGGGLRLLLRRRRRPDPYREARRGLQRLSASGSGDGREVCAAATILVRQGVEATTGLRTGGLGTTEIAAGLGRLPFPGPSAAALVVDFLEHADRVRYSPQTPAPEETKDFLRQAREALQALAPTHPRADRSAMN